MILYSDDIEFLCTFPLPGLLCALLVVINKVHCSNISGALGSPFASREQNRPAHIPVASTISLLPHYLEQ